MQSTQTAGRTHDARFALAIAFRSVTISVVLGRIRLVLVAAIAALACALGSCGQTPPTLTPYPQALLVIDTDLPAPSIAGVMRVDFFAEDGTWFESRTEHVPDPSAWPLSLGVYSTQKERDSRVLVRVRIYPEGRERDYRGERYAANTLEAEGAGTTGAGDASADAQAEDAALAPVLPALNRSPGVDETPQTEPRPHVTIDRLLIVSVAPGTAARATVVLSGECMGTMAKLAAESFHAPVWSEAMTCVDRHGVLAPVDVVPLTSDTTLPTHAESVVGSFGAGQPCESPGNDRVACVPSGGFLFGGERLGTLSFLLSAYPDRLARMSRFFIDRNEVTVGDYKAALAKGLATPPVNELTADSFKPKDGSACALLTKSTQNDALSINCISWNAARAYCQFLGGDLPTEAQWEYAAVAAGRPLKTRFPTGDTPPTCDDAVFARAYGDASYGPDGTDCGQSLGLAPPNGKDVTPSGIVSLAGGLTEMARDSFRVFTDPCWQNATFDDPFCDEPSRATRSLRGGSWRASPQALDVLARDDIAQPVDDFIGFRCVYPAIPTGLP